MKVRFFSRFVIPGLEGKDEIDFEPPSLTLQEFLEELSVKSSGRMKFINPSSSAISSTLFDIEINGIPIQDSKESLKMVLKEGDKVTINLVAMGGG